MGTRLLLAVAFLVLFSSVAFAGPQIVISDPLCTGSEISLGSSASYSFTYNGQTSLTFCNTTSTTFTSLNFTVSTPTAIDLSGFYCGAPDTFSTAAFDSCLVLDPNQAAPAGQNGLLFTNNILQPDEKAIHQFVTTYFKPTFPFFFHDGPSDFYQDNNCFYGCQTHNVGTITGNEVHLSFDLLTPLELRPAICLQFNVEVNVPCGLLPNHQFTLTFECDPRNTDTANPCTSLPNGSGVSFVASPRPDQVNFPAAVPEPATLLLVATAGIPAFLRRRKKL